MRGKKLILSILVALMCSAMVFAGGSSDGKSGGDAEIRVFWWGGDSRHVPTLEVLEKYSESHPGVSIEGEYQGWDGYYQKTITQLAGGTAADLLQIDQPWFTELCSRGDIFNEVNPDIIDLSGFDPAFLEMYSTYNGKLYGLPTGVNVNTMFIDKNLLREHGIDPDQVWTWESIVEDGKKLHEDDSSLYLISAPPDNLRYWFEILMAQRAGGVVDEDKNLMFTREQAVDAFTYLKQWFDYGIVQPFTYSSLFYQKFNEDPAWIDGKLALAWGWCSSMDRDIGRRDMTTTTFPVAEDAVQSGVLMRPSQIFVFPKSSPYSDIAQDLANYMFNDPEAVEILNTCRGVPPTSNARDVLTEKGLIPERTNRATAMGIEQAGWPQSSWQMNTEVCKVMQDVIDEFGYGRLTPEEAADRLIANLTSTLARL